MHNNTNMPLISVIVPIFKVERYLHDCIESILSQSYKNIELILVNDGSPDGCAAICEHYHKRNRDKIKYIFQSNAGCSSARNTGLSHANGEFISFVDGDDTLPVNFYSSMLVHFDKIDEQTAFIFCPIRFLKGGKINHICYFNKDKFDSNEDGDQIPPPLLNSSCNKIFPRNKILELNIKFPTETHFSEDMAFVLKLLSINKKAIFNDGTHYDYNIHSGGITSQHDEHHLNRFIRESIITYKDVATFCREHGVEQTLLQSQIVRSLIPDFYFKLSMISKDKENLDWYKMLVFFYEQLRIITTSDTMQKVKRIRYSLSLKFLIYKHLFFLVKAYRYVRAIKKTNRYDI